MSKRKILSVDEIVEMLTNTSEHKIETQLLQKQLIRDLYKQLGTPSKEDFPDVYGTAGSGWEKVDGYTNGISLNDRRLIEGMNKTKTIWGVAHPSKIKMDIVETYVRDGWHCEVGAYNVTATKYIQHPRYDKVYVYFISTRDCNKYMYGLLTN